MIVANELLFDRCSSIQAKMGPREVIHQKLRVINENVNKTRTRRLVD